MSVTMLDEPSMSAQFNQKIVEGLTYVELYEGSVPSSLTRFYVRLVVRDVSAKSLPLYQPRGPSAFSVFQRQSMGFL